ncbi:MAG TPA: DUF1844 domain-containing protein [Pyrinomonadaceae bacterium]|jgi:hypothetical protein|nr:DUF1844 domain-containing protein [Pyrinomonadaceae bacterium]
MSEEKPVFKVRDRRLFNPDGTPREVEGRHEDQPTETSADAASAQPDATIPRQESAATTASKSNEATPAVTPQPAPAESGTQASKAQPATSTASARQPQNFEGASHDEEVDDVPGADDPASFINFLMSIASNAAAALGMMEHPATGQRGVDLPLGKHWIDVLGMIQQKTSGNLVPQEQQILEGILADLRMQYVSLTSARQSRPSGPRGFTGSDIIGGK